VSSPGTTLSGRAVGASSPRRARAEPRLLRRYLQNLEVGALRLTLPSGVTIEHKGARPGPEAVLVLRRWRALWRIMIEGDLGLARAYMDDDCRSPDIKTLLDFGTQNEIALAKATSGAFLSRLLDRLRHARRANTKRGSRRNIAAHYDLGNAFYAQWLDAGMNYSSAYYAREGQTLEEAQDAKLDRIAALNRPAFSYNFSGHAKLTYSVSEETKVKCRDPAAHLPLRIYHHGLPLFWMYI